MLKEIRQLSALSLSDHYRRRELSPLEVTRTVLDALPDLNRKLNMVYDINADHALQEAEASEQRWSKGVPHGPFDGILTTIKDSLPNQGGKRYRGSAAHNPNTLTATIDAPVVARQQEAGMIAIGKTTMPDFGILASGYSSHHGITRNPWNPQKTTGGSSSGAAATIASGISPLVVGTDIVGSIRLPASFCGLFGLKPSQGRVPYYPPNAPTLVAGPMSRTVSDSAAFMNILTQPDPRDYTALPESRTDYLAELEQSLRGTRLGLLTDIGFGIQPQADMKAAAEKAAGALEQQGFSIEPLTSPFKKSDDACAELFYKQRCYNELNQFDEAIQQRTPYIYQWTRDAEGTPATALIHAMNEMRAMRETVMAWFQKIDYLLLPTTPITAYDAELPAPEPDQLFAPWANTWLFNLTEQPAASINCGVGEDGMPMGLQIVGRRFDDLGVLQLSRLYEKIRPTLPEFPPF